jgi:hypothetical protein
MARPAMSRSSNLHHLIQEQGLLDWAVLPKASIVLPPKNDPKGMDDAGDVAEKGQQNIQPELKAKAHLQKNADRRQKDGKENADNVHGVLQR